MALNQKNILKKCIKNYDRGNAVGRFFNSMLALCLSVNRKRNMLQLLDEDDVEGFIKSLLSRDDINKAPTACAKFLEKEIDVGGELTIISEGENNIAHYLDVDENKSYRVYYTDKPSNLFSGAKINIQGWNMDDRLVAYAPGGKGGGGRGKGGKTSAGKIKSEGEQKTAAILVSFSDLPINVSRNVIHDMVFGTGSSVDRLYREISSDETFFTGDVFGPVTISNMSTEHISKYRNWSKNAKREAKQIGVSIQSYDKLIYVFPSNMPRGYPSRGTIGGQPSESWILAHNTFTICHEVGHNLGLLHAGKSVTDAYGDFSDIMGRGPALKQVNAPHREERNWIGDNIVPVSSANSYSLNALEAPNRGAKILKIADITSPENSFYISYRKRIGFDVSLTNEYADKVNIHIKEDAVPSPTYFIKALGLGESFTLNNFTVTVTSVEEQAGVQIVFA
jgi:hypothetical protein